MANGLTHDQMLERMYTELVGLDGHSGMVEEHRQVKAEVKVISSTMVTQAKCAEIRKSAGNRKDKLLMRVKDVLLILVALAGLLWGSGLLRGAP